MERKEFNWLTDRFWDCHPLREGDQPKLPEPMQYEQLSEADLYEECRAQQQHERELAKDMGLKPRNKNLARTSRDRQRYDYMWR